MTTADQIKAMSVRETELVQNPGVVDVIKSPCIRNCCLDEQDVCLGCFRSLEEIKSWSLVDSVERQRIIANANGRKLGRVC